MNDFPSFPVNQPSFPASAPVQAELKVKKTRGPRRGIQAPPADPEVLPVTRHAAGVLTIGAPKRKGRPPKDATAAPKAPASNGVIDLLPHLIGLQEAHVKPLTRLYHIIAEMAPSDRRRVSQILARVFA